MKKEKSLIMIIGSTVLVAVHVTSMFLAVSPSTADATSMGEVVIKPKVFGVGLSKTGTTSMAEAMMQLGYTTLHTDQSLAPFMHHPDDPQSLNGYYDDVDSVFDIPTAAYYPELLEAYPDSKFILTVRDSQQWFQSFKSYLEEYLYYKWGCEYPERIQRLHEYVYGTRFPSNEWIEAFDQHTRDVQSFFADRPDQLLTLDVSQPDAWQQLCSFLDTKEGPCAELDTRNVEFPRENTATEHGVDKECPATAMVAARNPDAPPEGNFAYVTLMCDPASDDQTEYLRMLLVLAENIRQFDTVNDIVTMVYGAITDEQWDLLTSQGLKLHKVGGVGMELSNPAEIPDSRASACYRAKTRALQLTQYDKVIFMDTDLLLKRDVQEMFEWPGFAAYSGYESPLNAGFLVMEPSHKAFTDIRDIAKSDSFNVKSGWLDYGPFPHWKNNGESDWTFYCAHTDQGLLYYYYDKVVKEANIDPDLDKDEVFTHFTGLNKPFLLDPANLDDVSPRFRESVIEWYNLWGRVEARLNKRLASDEMGSSKSLEKTEGRINRILRDKDVYGGKKGKRERSLSGLGSATSIQKAEDRISRVLHDKDVYGGKKGKRERALSELGSPASVQKAEDRISRVLHDKDVYGGKKGKRERALSELGSPSSIQKAEDRISRVLHDKDVYGGKKGKRALSSLGPN